MRREAPSGIETKRLRFMYRGRELKDSLTPVQGGDAISLFILPVKKEKEVSAHSFLVVEASVSAKKMM